MANFNNDIKGHWHGIQACSTGDITAVLPVAPTTQCVECVNIRVMIDHTLLAAPDFLHPREARLCIVQIPRDGSFIVQTTVKDHFHTANDANLKLRGE